jgi:putative exosortase-associated protein (TIGR04073 family)
MELRMKKMFKMLLILSALFFATPYAAMADSYPTKVGEKLSNGIVNVVTGVAEIPKTIMVTSRTKDPAYAATAGFMTGMVHMLGRTLFGVMDLVTFMIPTKPLVNPDYIWKNFDTETTYNMNWQMR